MFGRGRFGCAWCALVGLGAARSGSVRYGMDRYGSALAAYSGFNESAMRCVSICGTAWLCRAWFGEA